MNITVEQHNALIKLTKNSIPFMVTGRYSYESDVEPSDIDLVILKKYMDSVETFLLIDNNKVNQGSAPNTEVNTLRVMYLDKIDILYIEDEVRWEELECFSRIIDGIRYTHPIHSMLSKIKMIMKTVPARHKSSFKHSRDLEMFITKMINTEYNE